MTLDSETINRECLQLNKFYPFFKGKILSDVVLFGIYPFFPLNLVTNS